MSMMRAMVVPRAGAPFELVERAIPAPGRHEVIGTIAAIGPDVDGLRKVGARRFEETGVEIS